MIVGKEAEPYPRLSITRNMARCGRALITQQFVKLSALAVRHDGEQIITQFEHGERLLGRPVVRHDERQPVTAA